MSKQKDTYKALKGTTFKDLFLDIETPLSPATEEEFLEDVVAVCYKTLFDIVKDPDEKAYVKISAIETLLDRAKGKPTQKTETKDTTDKVESLTQEQLELAISIALSQKQKAQEKEDNERNNRTNQSPDTNAQPT